MFGQQIAQYGKIIDFRCANFFWNLIVLNQNNSWEELNKIYKPIFNSLSTEFRKVAPINK